jgi:hypothetical protein
MEYIGLRKQPDQKDINKYKDFGFYFDIHPDYSERNDVYVAVNKQGKEIKQRPNEEWLTIIPCGRYMYITIVLELGDKGMLAGKAFSYYQRIKNQLEREMLYNFQEHDLFVSEDDRIGIRVIKQEGNYVIYEKHKNPIGPFWQVPCNGRARMLIHEFAAAVLKLSPRYKNLIPVKLLVPK